jgi:hypothetical protein
MGIYFSPHAFYLVPLTYFSSSDELLSQLLISLEIGPFCSCWNLRWVPLFVCLFLVLVC